VWRRKPNHERNNRCGGIGGLSLALSLHQGGIDCSVYESSPAIEFLAWELICNQTRFANSANSGSATSWRNWRYPPPSSLISTVTPTHLVRTARRGRGYRWPQYSISRGELQKLLMQTVLERLGKIKFLPAIIFPLSSNAGTRSPPFCRPVDAPRYCLLRRQYSCWRRWHSFRCP